MSDKDETGESRMVARVPRRARVTATWLIDLTSETTEGGGVRCSGWIADAYRIDALAVGNASKVRIEWDDIGGFHPEASTERDT